MLTRRAQEWWSSGEGTVLTRRAQEWWSDRRPVRRECAREKCHDRNRSRDLSSFGIRILPLVHYISLGLHISWIPILYRGI